MAAKGKFDLHLDCCATSNRACTPTSSLCSLLEQSPYFSPVSHDKCHQLLIQLQSVQFGVKDVGVGLHERQNDGVVLQVDIS